MMIQRRTRVALVTAAVLAAVTLPTGTAIAAPATPPAGAACPWVGPAAKHESPSARADAVLSRMSIDQKLLLMWPSSGTVLGSGVGYQQVTKPIPELCVPSVIFQGSAGGIRGTTPGTATRLPSPIDIAATFDPSAATAFAAVQGQEAWVKGIDGVQAPYINVDRVPQDGRSGESYGEDPYLSSIMTASDIHELTNQHEFSITQSFAAYAQENGRNRTGNLANVLIDDRTLHEVYNAPLESAVDAGAASLMCTYTEINGVWSCQNPDLIQTIIEEQMGFAGFIRTDAQASHDDVATVNAGTTYLNPFTATNQAAVKAAVQNGQVSQARLNDDVHRILQVMFQWGVFDRTRQGNYDTNGRTPDHVATAEQLSEEGTVLLKNDGSVLPLNRSSVSSVAVIGPNAGDAAVTALSGSGNVAVVPGQVVTPLAGIQAAAGSGVTVTSYTGTDPAAAAQTAAGANVAIVVGALPAGEGSDLTSNELPDPQDAIIQAVAAANPNTVVVLDSGNPVLMPWLSSVKGVVEQWFSGEQGGTALGRILFGDVNPSGKLPLTFPTSDTATPVGTPAQYPGDSAGIHFSEGLNVGYRGYQANGITPLFPFGYGLSYTQFRMSDLSVSRPVIDGLGSVAVSANVTNTGSTVGSEVPQLYLAYPASAGEPPLQLRGFDRVTLQPGQSTRVHFTLSPDDLRVWDSAASVWTVPEGRYTVKVGDSSANLPLSGSFAVAGTTGTRKVTISAPSEMTAGSSYTVSATLTAGGDMPLTLANLNLSAPEGWTVKRITRPTLSSLILGASKSLTVSWKVTVPSTAIASIPVLRATASYRSIVQEKASMSAGAAVTVTPSP
jgi:beta-glucosidase